MTVLQFINGFGKRAMVALMITGLVALSVAAQKVAPQQEGKHYGDPGFKGEPINLNVVNADVRDILNYITQEYGINFVIDKSVKNVPVTVNISDVPWNIALDSVLQSQDLGVQVNGSILRVAERQVLAAEASVQAKINESRLDGSPLYTEFIRLNYSRATGSLSSAAGSAGGFTGGAPSGGGSNAGGAGASDQGILGIIQRRLSRRGAIEVDARSNTLIITDVRENIDAIKALVKLLDTPEPQVEIEARIVIATKTFSRDLGVQLAALVFGPRGSGFRCNRSGKPGGNGKWWRKRRRCTKHNRIPSVWHTRWRRSRTESFVDVIHSKHGYWFDDRNFRNRADQCIDYRG
jgi:type IV pilus assembly protein PilQ